ncbi:hypothetical protein POJ06DRAFT_254747 [Lipomyces tetrasporus]|uniref:Uncharacterized protein n=1 Tax=Lipomyces tetrasporus TaxID=54092 RepID=A0AAD7QS01_9ASCO|nr:uncharacterized protein POJ06DRAFT_254747 [Lipomyces tetrasporus]KAJ8099876.1 hypothetical protein POJ06DRAFT_254747 [Lipomyces tetrasporus]
MAKKRKYARDASSHDEALSDLRDGSSKAPTQASAMSQDELAFSLRRVSGLLVHEQPTNYSLLDDPVGFDKTEALAVSLQRSRRTWLTGCMFEKFWTRPQRGRKLADGQYNARDKMAKLCECNVQIGPHFFELRLFTVKVEASTKDLVSTMAMPATSKDSNASATQSCSSTSSATLVATPSEIPAMKSFSIKTPITEAPITSGQQIGPAPIEPPATSSQATEQETGNLEQQHTSSTETQPLTSTEPEQSATPGQTTPLDTTTAPHLSQKDPVTIQQSTSRPEPSKCSPKPPSKHPNEELIDRLHALARQDPQFGELMKSVASGKASAEEVRRFQVYIAQSRQAEGEPGSQRTSSTSVPPLQSSHNPTYHPETPLKPRPDLKRKERELLRDQTLVFEFKENPTDRFLFPKDSVVKLWPNGTVSAVCFLLAPEPAEAPAEAEATPKPDKKERKKKKTIEQAETDSPPSPSDPKYYTPLNITFYGIPRKMQDVFIRSVHPKQQVMKYFRETSTKLNRTKDWWVYYKLNASDVETMDKVVEPIGNNNPNLKKKPWSTNKDAVSNILVHLSGQMLTNGIVGQC